MAILDSAPGRAEGAATVTATVTAAGPTRDLRVESFRPLVPPAILLEELPLPPEAVATVRRGRDEICAILDGDDDRLIAVVGPCSIHDPAAALDYARRLRAVAGELADDLCVVMRVYFEKPRTTVGWKGLINDPFLDGSFAINQGLRLARRILIDVNALGLPAGCEFLDPITPQFIADAVAWGAIGARTTESQVHRELAAGLSMPVGFKNGTDGSIQIAVDALRAAAYPHRFLGVTEQGLAAIVATRGNEDCHVILRGSNTGPNFDRPHVQETLAALRAAKLPARLIVDTSHGNSRKDHRNQPAVAADVAAQVAAGEPGIIGVLMESFLVEGRQDLVVPGASEARARGVERAERTPGSSAQAKASLVYGQSVTDACIGWDTTVPVLHELARAVRARRKA